MRLLILIVRHCYFSLASIRAEKDPKGKRCKEAFTFACLLGNSPISLAPDMEIPQDLTHFDQEKKCVTCTLRKLLS